jgi:hypothetical protein
MKNEKVKKSTLNKGIFYLMVLILNAFSINSHAFFSDCEIYAYLDPNIYTSKGDLVKTLSKEEKEKLDLIIQNSLEEKGYEVEKNRHSFFVLSDVGFRLSQNNTYEIDSPFFANTEPKKRGGTQLIDRVIGKGNNLYEALDQFLNKIPSCNFLSGWPSSGGKIASGHEVLEALQNYARKPADELNDKEKELLNNAIEAIQKSYPQMTTQEIRQKIAESPNK